MPYDIENIMRGVKLELATPHMTRMTNVVRNPETLPNKWGENRSERIPIPSRETIDAARVVPNKRNAK